MANPPSTSTTSSSATSSVSSTQNVIERKSVPTLLPHVHPHPAFLTPTGDPSTHEGMKGESSGVDGEGGGGEGGHKERLQNWIKKQASEFLEKWATVSSNNPSHAIVSRLKEATEGLDYKSPACLAALDVSIFHSSLTSFRCTGLFPKHSMLGCWRQYIVCNSRYKAYLMHVPILLN